MTAQVVIDEVVRIGDLPPEAPALKKGFLSGGKRLSTKSVDKSEKGAGKASWEIRAAERAAAAKGGAEAAEEAGEALQSTQPSAATVLESKPAVGVEEEEEEELMPWDPEPQPKGKKGKKGAKAKAKAKGEGEAAEKGEAAEEGAMGTAALAKEHREWAAGGKKDVAAQSEDEDDEEEEEAEVEEGSEGAAGVRRRARKHFKFNAAPKLVLPNGRDVTNGMGGILKRVLRAGNSLVGKPPKDAMVKVHYTGWLMDGTRFDSTRDRFGHPFFKLGSGFERRCLEEGVATMNRGELAEFVCTSQYAYGAEGWKEGGSSEYKVPPRATIRWEVELYSWSGFNGDHSKMGDGEMMDQAYHLKARGTEYFKMGQWESAAERYHEAVQLIDNPKFNLHDELPTGWALEASKLLLSCQLNEAQCEIKREEWNAASR